MMDSDRNLTFGGILKQRKRGFSWLRREHELALALANEQQGGLGWDMPYVLDTQEKREAMRRLRMIIMETRRRQRNVWSMSAATSLRRENRLNQGNKH